MNVYYINLISFFKFYNDTESPTSIEYLKSLIKNRNNKIVLSALYEVWEPEKILFALDMLDIDYKQDNVILLIDIYSYNNHNNWDMVNTIVYDSLLCLTYKSEANISTPNLSIDKFLFLVGKPYKKQRILPMYELYQRECLDKCEWSLYYQPYLEEKVRKQLPHMLDDDYLKFMNYIVKDIDSISPNFQSTSVDFHQVGFSPTAELFARASVSLVTETFFSPTVFWFITEKTWKAIKNYHPFVLIGYKESYEYLESLGFDTFQYAVKHPHEKLVGTDEEVIRMCIDNILHLMNNKQSYEKELIDSAIHNYGVFESMANAYNNKIHPNIEELIGSYLLPFHKVKNDSAKEVYEKLWANYGADGED